MAVQTSVLFGRQMSCVIGAGANAVKAGWGDQDALQVNGNDMDANVQRNLIGKHPNTAHIKIWNLSPDNIQTLSAGNGADFPVVLQAGFRGTTDTVFSGQGRYIWAERTRDGDTILNIRSGDLEAACLGRMTAPGAPKTPLQDALQLISTAMGAGIGNLLQVLPQVGADLVKSFSQGALTGSAMDAMDLACKKSGLEWSIQNGEMQFLPLGASLGNQAFVLNSNTGLVNSPSVDSKGLLKFECLLQPGLTPGMVVQMDAKYVKGFYRVERCEWDLSTFATQFYQKCEGVAVAA
jgi:hypothetical protein